LVSSLDKEGHALSPLDDATLQIFGALINDGIEGVRIGVARFVALVYRNRVSFFSVYKAFSHEVLLQETYCDMRACAKRTIELLLRLSRDTSSEVRSFAARASLEESAKRADTPPPENKRRKERLEQVALFSRPPISSVHETSEVKPNVWKLGRDAW
jgi:hypothetical protein